VSNSSKLVQTVANEASEPLSAFKMMFIGEDSISVPKGKCGVFGIESPDVGGAKEA
jgi:hypothetical protein